MKKLYLSFIIVLVISLIPGKLYSQQFTEVTGISLQGIGQGSVDWGDYNNDGYPDILMSGETAAIGLSTPATIIYKNNGDNTFTDQISIFLPGVTLGSLKWADFDSDGDLDILLTGTTTGNTIDAISKIYRNDSGVFTEVASGLPGIYFSSVAVGDNDRDGDLDILMTGMQTTGERISAIFSNNGNFTFTQLPGTIFTKICKGYTSFGDYDNDGYPDVLITGETATDIRISKIYHNNGNGIFTELTTTLLRGMAYNSGAWADFNGDGFVDIVLSGEEVVYTPGPVNILVMEIYINNKNGTFTLQSGNSFSGAKKCSVACGDYDNDGDADLFLSGDSNNTPISEVYTNNGSGVFTKNSSITITGTYESSSGLSDYDNDGDLDLLITGFDKPGNLWSKIYKNNATIANIKPVKPLNLNDLIDKTTVTLSWDRVSGDETASNSISYNVRVGLSATSSDFVTPQADNTGNRKVTSIGNAQLTNKFIYRNLRWNTTYYASVQAIDNSYSGGEFSSPVNFSITPQQPTELTGRNISTTSILLKWKRGNGDRSILIAREGNSSPPNLINDSTYFANPAFGDGSPIGSTGWFCIFKGEADSVLLTGLAPEKDYTVYAIELQGVTGSEIYATATNAENDNLGVFSSGVFTTLTGNSMPGLRYSMAAWGDYNKDNFLDILLTGRDIGGTQISKVFRNNGNNTFSDQTGIILPGVDNGSSAWGDFDNDSTLDILITGNNASLGNISGIYRNNGNNTFSEQTEIVLPGVTYSSVAWADYDNDADLDLLITGTSTTDIPVSKIFRNNGNNTFTEQISIVLTGVRHSSVAWGDYDNDGWLDILLTGLNTSGQNISKVYRNNGNNSFSVQANINLQGVSYSSVAWGDYDRDNFLDILITGATGYYPKYYPATLIYHNNGNSTFTELAGQTLKGVSNGSAEWGDYNNDGLLDILLMGKSELEFEFKIYLNNGRNGFAELTSLNLPGAIACSSSSADYDNDGDLDILFSGYSGALLSQIYRNNLYMMAGIIKPNERPVAPTGLKSEVTPRNLKLTWDGITTDETFFVNMSYNIRCRLPGDPIWKVAPQASLSGFRSLNDLGNAQLNRSYTIKDPVSGTYEWQVQAVDQSYSGSEWSAIESVIIKTTQAFFKTDTVCLGLATTFTDQSVATDGVAGWKWDFKDGTTSALRNPVHTYASAGTYGVKLLITSSAGEKDSLVQIVIVKKRPASSFTAPTVCIGAPTQLTSTTNLNGLTASKWLWSFGDGQSSAAEQPGTHNYSVSGTFKVKLKTVTTNGCSDSIISNVNVAKYPESSISVAGDFVTTDGKLTFCDGITLQLTAKNDPLYTYQWRKDANNWTGAESNTYPVNKTSGSGIYDVIIINTLDNANCKTFSEQKSINIKPTPVNPIIISDNYTSGQCIGANPITLKVDPETAAYKYVWARNEVELENSNLGKLEGFPEPGNFTVTAEQNGCFAKSNVFQVTSQGAPDKPVLFARGPVEWYIGCNIQSASKYKWYYNDNLIAGAQENFYVADQKLGSYFVRIGNSAGCYTRSDVLVIPTNDYLPSLKKAGDTNPFAGLKIYPNPSPGRFNLEMDNELYGDLNISIISQGGKEILRIKFDKSTTHFSTEIDLSGQTSGAYFVKISLDSYSTTNQIIIE